MIESGARKKRENLPEQRGKLRRAKENKGPSQRQTRVRLPLGYRKEFSSPNASRPAMGNLSVAAIRGG